MIDIYCPTPHGREPTMMVDEGHGWSYKDGKPVRIMYQFQCPICGTVLRTELPIIYYKEGK